MEELELPITTRLNVRNVADLCGCFHALVWNSLDEPIQPIDVLRVIAKKDAGHLNPYPEPAPGSSSCQWTRDDHIQRIAWFVVHGWDIPIEVNLQNQPDDFYPGWPVADGLHRVAAALVRLDEYIEAVIAGSLKNHIDLLSTSSIRLSDLQLTEFSLEGQHHHDEWGISLA